MILAKNVAVSNCVTSCDSNPCRNSAVRECLVDGIGVRPRVHLGVEGRADGQRHGQHSRGCDDNRCANGVSSSRFPVHLPLLARK